MKKKKLIGVVLLHFSLLLEEYFEFKEIDFRDWKPLENLEIFKISVMYELMLLQI